MNAATFLVLALLTAADEVYPAKTWENVAPQAVDLDPAGLDAFAARVGGRGCMVRRGRMAFAWGDAAKRGDVASAAKPVYGHILVKAIEEGRLAGLDEPVSQFEPALTGKDRAITFRQMINQTSCYGVAEAPGAAFDYNDWQMALFLDTLVEKVLKLDFGRVDAEVLVPWLAGPLGCEDAPTLLAFGPGPRAGRLAISPRDFARFGLLYLREGRWRDGRLIAAESVRLAVRSPLPGGFPRTRGEPAPLLPGRRTLGSTKAPDDQTDHLGSYSYAWWTNGLDRDGRRHWPGLPVDAFAALGHGGKRALWVVPSLDLVASWNDARIDGRDAEDEAMRLLVRACHDAP